MNPYRRRTLIDVVGLLIATGLFLFCLQVVNPYQEIVAGIGTSVLFAALLDLLVAAQAFFFGRRRQRFFGREFIREGTYFVYPDFVMNSDVAEVLREHNQQLLYTRPRSRYEGKVMHRVDLPRVVAGNDVRALLYMSNVFAATTSRPATMLIDRDILDDPDRSFISFGLSSNDCTHLYLEVAEKPMFEIVPTDDGSEYLRMISGSEYRSTPDRQFGLILRFSPSIQEAPSRRWFLVAGLGPLGTTAASYYLAHNWAALSREIPSESDFAIVISTGMGAEQVAKRVELIVEGSSYSKS